MPAASIQDVFENTMPQRLKAKPDVVQKINAVCQFNISGPGGGTWALDCTKPGGEITPGAPAAPAKCTVSASEGDFLNIVNGKLNPQMAFMAGKLKIQGDMGVAMKLTQIIG